MDLFGISNFFQSPLSLLNLGKFFVNFIKFLFMCIYLNLINFFFFISRTLLLSLELLFIYPNLISLTIDFYNFIECFWIPLNSYKSTLVLLKSIKYLEFFLIHLNLFKINREFLLVYPKFLYIILSSLEFT